MSEDFLAGMARSSRMRVEQARALCPLPQLRAQALAQPAPPPLQLSASGFDLIAELKLRSPAAGSLQPDASDLPARIGAYAGAGAASISILTEPSRFDGSLEHLAAGALALRGRVPVMRKDFLVDPYQAFEARAAGAGGLLVILRMLDPPAIEALLDAAVELRLFVLLEAFDEADLEQAAVLVGRYGAAAQLLVGVNCRDLVTLQVVPGRLEALADRLPPGIPAVAESGLETPADAARLVHCGYTVALVGSALMRTPDPRALAQALLAAGRDAAARRGG